MDVTKAKEWFNKNYHTPMDSFLGNKGVPVLHGIHPDGQEEWEDIPIEKVLQSYSDHRNKELSERVERLEKTLEKVKVGYEWNMEHVKENVDRADYEMYDEIKEVLKRKGNYET